MFGYPLYDYGLGLVSDCRDWLVPDWESQPFDASECSSYVGQSQNAAIAADGADQVYRADQNYGAAQADTQQIYGAYAERSAAGAAAEPSRTSEPRDGDGSVAAGNVNASHQPDTLIYLGDGTNYAVTSYWLAGGDLHYITSYGAEDSVPIGEIDLQRTVDANAERGAQFTLRRGRMPRTLANGKAFVKQ